MQVQSKAKAAALRIKFESANIVHELRQQASQLTNAIKQQELQA